MRHIEKKNLREWLDATDSAAKGTHYPMLYKRINRLLSTPSRNRRAVSIFKLNTYTKDGDNVIVPTKVLSSGKIDHKISIAALEYSAKALSELKVAGCKVVDIKEMIGKDKIKLMA